MPLTRDNITYSSRIALPVHTLFDLGIGLAWILQDPSRTATPSFSILRQIYSVRGAGFVVISAGVLLAISLLLHHRAMAAGVLVWGGIVYLLLAVLFTVSIWHGGSIGAPLWAAYAGLLHLASARSLLLREGSRP